MQQNKTCIFIFLPTYLGSFPNYFHRFTFFFLFAISQLKHKITPFLITLLCILNAIPINHNTIWNFYKCIKEPYRESYWIFWYQKNPMSHISIYCLFRWLFCKKKKRVQIFTIIAKTMYHSGWEHPLVIMTLKLNAKFIRKSMQYSVLLYCVMKVLFKLCTCSTCNIALKDFSKIQPFSPT